MAEIQPLTDLRPGRFDRPDILKKLTTASRQLAELKGVAASMPNEGILISTLGLQEAKDSSAIENIVTTHDELFQEVDLLEIASSAATKEVARYRQALRVAGGEIPGRFAAKRSEKTQSQGSRRRLLDEGVQFPREAPLCGSARSGEDVLPYRYQRSGGGSGSGKEISKRSAGLRAKTCDRSSLTVALLRR